MNEQIEELRARTAALYDQGQHEAALPVAEEAVRLARKVVGNEHQEMALASNLLGLVLTALGQHAEARVHLDRALDVLVRLHGEENENVGTVLANLGTVLEAQGDNPGARAFYERALNVRRRVLGDDHTETGRSHARLGILLVDEEDAAAVPHLERALAIAQREFGDDHPTTAEAQHFLGASLCNLGVYPRARGYLEAALATRTARLREDDPATAWSRILLGVVLREQGQTTEARPLFEKGLEVLRRTLAEEHPDLAIAEFQFGTLLLALGDYAGSHACYRHALEVCSQALGGEHQLVGLIHNNCGMLLQAEGNLVGARQHYERAWHVTSQSLGPNHPRLATILNNYGLLLHFQGDYRDALPCFQQAVAVLRQAHGEDHPSLVRLLGNLALARAGQRDLDGAVRDCEQALELSRRVQGTEHPDTALVLSNLGALVAQGGNLTRAGQLLGDALALHRRLPGNAHPNVASCLQCLAVLLQARGDLVGARQALEEALEMRRRTQGEDHHDTAAGQAGLASVLVALHRPTEALALLLKAAGNLDLVLGQICSVSSERQRGIAFRSARVEYETVLSLAYQFLPSCAPEAFERVLRRKALAAEATSAQRDAVLGGRYPELEPQLRELLGLRRQISEQSLAGPGAEGEKEYRARLAGLRQRKELVEAGLARQIPEMNIAQRLQTATRQAVAQALPPDSVLVEFVRFDVREFNSRQWGDEWKAARYLAFVLPAGQPDAVRMIDLGKASLIDRRVAALRNRVGVQPGARGTRDVRRRPPAATLQPPDTDPGPVLRKSVFDPLRPALQGRTRLLLCPDGALSVLPFEVLPDREGGLLGDHFRISYLGCGRDALRLHLPPVRTPAAPLVLAAPDFDLAASGRRDPAIASGGRSRDYQRDHDSAFPRLPGTAEEGRRIAALLGVQPWLGSSALEGRLKETRSPRILHLATHGFFLPDEPNQPDEVVGSGRLLGRVQENPLLRSGLALAGANTFDQGGLLPPEAGDGVLTAEDVMGLDLLGTELVVLSACETGLGEVQSGEGVLGLRRAFILAGARTVIFSLWKVPDLPTAILMEAFYANLLKRKMDRDEALRQARWHVRDVTIGELRQSWLSAENLRRLTTLEPGVWESLRDLAAAPDDHRPFADVYHWGAFLCQGDPGPLPGRSARGSAPGVRGGSNAVGQGREPG